MVDPNSLVMGNWDDFVAKHWNNIQGLPHLEGSAAKARWNDVFKKRYKQCNIVENWSGLGAGDEISKLSDEAWEEIISAHPDTAEFRLAPFEFAADIDCSDINPNWYLIMIFSRAQGFMKTINKQ